MTENLEDEPYRLKNSQAKGAKLDASLLWLIAGGDQNENFREKTHQVYLIVIRE